MTFSPFAYAKRILLQTSRPTAFLGIAPVCKQRRFYNNNSCLHCHLQLQLSIPTAQDMEDLGAILSMDTSAGDVLCLQGDLGAGKTCLSRGFVQTRTRQHVHDDKVTSPTYLLTNTYPTHDGIMQVYYVLLLYYNIHVYTLECLIHSCILIVIIWIYYRIHHMDLYRLSGKDDHQDLGPLDLENVFTNGACG
jgi:tRNA threonylcarbamoyl adenosine modification protein YjeE